MRSLRNQVNVWHSELKFAFDPEDLPKITRALGAGTQRPSRSTLVSTYYDTAGGSLKKEKMTLRVRRQGRRFVQTVKSEDSRADLAIRGQWEDPIRQEVPDLSAAESGACVQRAGGADELRPLFTTTVRRSIIRLTPLPTTLIEAAIDEGEIQEVGGSATEPICEPELELKHGECAVLYDVALRLLEAAPLRLDPRSKSDRGYALVARRKKPPPIARAAPVRFAAGTTVEDFLQQVGRSCLHQAVRNEPAALAGVPEGVHQMRVAVRHLRSALSALKPMLSTEHYGWANGELKSLATALSASRNWGHHCGSIAATWRRTRRRELARCVRCVSPSQHCRDDQARRKFGDCI